VEPDLQGFFRLLFYFAFNEFEFKLNIISLYLFLYNLHKSFVSYTYKKTLNYNKKNYDYKNPCLIKNKQSNREINKQ